MIFLCCAMQDYNSIVPRTIYRYFDSDYRTYKDFPTIQPCANVNLGSNCLGFSIKDVTTSPSFGGTFGFLAVEEYIDSQGKLTHLGVFDLQHFKVVVLPVETLLQYCELFNRCVVLNYSYVDKKFLRKKPSTVVDKKNTSSYTEHICEYQDTHGRMTVSELRKLLQSRGMKLGASCVTTFVKFDETRHIRDDFYFKDASVVRVTSKEGEDTQLNYFAGDLSLITTLLDTDFGLQASGGVSDRYVGLGRVGVFHKDIRNNLFKFYDTYKDNLVPQFSYSSGNNYSTIDTYLLCNITTYYQQDLNSQYVNDASRSDIQWYSLFRLLSFKHNLKHFTKEFRYILQPCIDNLDDLLKCECNMLRKQGHSKREIQKAIDWCVNELNNENVVWKNL